MLTGGIGDSPIDYGGATDVDTTDDDDSGSSGGTSTSEPVTTGIPAFAPDAGLDTGGDDGGSSSSDSGSDDDGGASESYQDFQDQFGDTDSVLDPTPEDRPDEDPQDDPGNATDPDSGSVNVTQPEVEDPVDTYDDGDSASNSSGGGTEAPENVVGSDGGGGGNDQPENEVSDDRIDQLLDQMEASSEQAAVLPLPVGGSSGLTAKGAAVAVAGAGALYLAFAGGS